ncbi:intracellular coagulation inhibitor 2-like [Ornithodoros turicata]|uniref:intracellular coagulation inhibitor 2-like n=1 Tax=Ornithodoros turicata TaxID=34597 RepID=UPI0031394309
MEHSVLAIIFTCVLSASAIDPFKKGSKQDSLVESSNLFGLQVLQLFSEKNVVFSPLSLSAVLSMVYMGAKGATAHQMAQHLNYARHDLSARDVLTAYSDLLLELSPPSSFLRSRPYVIDSASAVLVSHDFALNETYRKNMRRAFNAAVEAVDFQKDSSKTVELVNDWAKEKTKGKIEKVLEYLPAQTKLFLLNALYFKGLWKVPFDPDVTSMRTFQNADGSKSLVPTMFAAEDFNYAYDPDMKAGVIELPYLGKGGVSLFVFLPENIRSFGQLIQSMTAERVRQVIASMREQRIEVFMPKLRLENRLQMKEPLDTLGMTVMFSDAADLSGMGSGDLKVDEVVHQAVLELDEKGARAAAVSGVAIAAKSLRSGKEFRVNRPFVFFIGHRDTGAVLFLGQVMSVKGV